MSKRGSTSRFPWVTVVVLFVLGARALIPVGFMLATVDGKPEVVLCSAHAHHGMHHHGVSNDIHKRLPDVDPTCPFAQSAGPTLLPTLPAPQIARISIHSPLALPSAQTYVVFGPIRLQTSRGPPLLS